MFELLNMEIKMTSPEKVYVFPQQLTQSEINKNVDKLHIIANLESDRTLYCLFDDIENVNRKYQVCFPMSHLDFKKYDMKDFKVLQRETVVSAEYKGEFQELSQSLAKLRDYATQQGYTTYTPYRYLFTLHKKKLFSKKPQEFTMEVHLPIQKVETEVL